MRMQTCRLGPLPHIRYLASAGFCALANNIILIASAKAGLNYVEMTLLSFALIGTTGYFLHARFTFRQAWNWQGYRRFMSGLAIGIPISIAILTLLCSALRLPMWIGAPLLTLTMLTYNFLSARAAITTRHLR